MRTLALKCFWGEIEGFVVFFSLSMFPVTAREVPCLAVTTLPAGIRRGHFRSPRFRTRQTGRHGAPTWWVVPKFTGFAADAIQHPGFSLRQTRLQAWLL